MEMSLTNSSQNTSSDKQISLVSKYVAGSMVVGLLLYASYNKFQQNKWKKKWKCRNVVAIKDFTRCNFEELFHVASYMENIVDKNGSCKLCQGKILACLFYEPSTRTSCSFQAAMLRLGGQVISINDVKTSSVSKGETLEDTIKCLQSYCNIIAIRHPEKGAAYRAIKACDNRVPILNAGDGDGEHPTQALLDLYTIYKEKNQKIDNLTITFVGDLKYGRTAHSLIPALAKFQNITINLVSPNILRIPHNIIDIIENQNTSIIIHEMVDLTSDILQKTDVLYVTRIQKERFENIKDYEQVKSVYIIDEKTLNECKKDTIVMHPLPRVDEISTKIDYDPRAVYFKQMRYGMMVRMALIALVLGVYKP